MNVFSIDPVWFWAAFGCLLLIIELLLMGGAGFFFGAGVAALAMMLISVMLPLSWATQWIIYTALALASTFVYWYFFNPQKIETEDPLLNNRMGRLVGTKTKLITPLQHGFGKVQITDAHWEVKGEEDLPEGAVVEVIGHEGTVLLVKSC